MRFSITLAVAALASATSASLVARQALPDCATQCIGVADLDNCQPTDNACLCRSNKFVTSSTNCIVQSCQGADLQNSLSAAQQLCAIVGVTLTSTPAGLSTAAQPTATAPAASGSRPASSGAVTGAASGSPAPAASGSGSAAGASPSNSASVNGVSAVAGIAALGLAVLAL